jgi:hypothetical protein
MLGTFAALLAAALATLDLAIRLHAIHVLDAWLSEGSAHPTYHTPSRDCRCGLPSSSPFSCHAAILSTISMMSMQQYTESCCQLMMSMQQCTESCCQLMMSMQQYTKSCCQLMMSMQQYTESLLPAHDEHPAIHKELLPAHDEHAAIHRKFVAS